VLWFQLEGSTRDEVSLTVQDPLNTVTVDKLKELVLEKRVLVDLPTVTQKQHMVVFFEYNKWSAKASTTYSRR